MNDPLQALFLAVCQPNQPLNQGSCLGLIESAQQSGQIPSELDSSGLADQLVALGDGIRAKMALDPGVDSEIWSPGFYGLVGRPDLIQ